MSSLLCFWTCIPPVYPVSLPIVISSRSIKAVSYFVSDYSSEGCIIGEHWAICWTVSSLKNWPRNKHCIIPMPIIHSFNHSRGAPNGVTFPTHLVNWGPEFFELSYFLKEPGFLMVFEMLVLFYIKAFIKVFKLRFVKKLRRISDVTGHQGYLFPGQLHWIYQLSFLSSLQGFCLCLLIHPG